MKRINLNEYNSDNEKKLETSVFQVFLLPKICFLIALLFFAEAFFRDEEMQDFT